MGKIVDGICIHELRRQDGLAVFDNFIDVFASPHNTCTVSCTNDSAALGTECVGVGGNANDDMCRREYGFRYFEKLKMPASYQRVVSSGAASDNCSISCEVPTLCETSQIHHVRKYEQADSQGANWGNIPKG